MHNTIPNLGERTETPIHRWSPDVNTKAHYMVSSNNFTIYIWYVQILGKVLKMNANEGAIGRLKPSCRLSTAQFKSKHSNLLRLQGVLNMRSSLPNTNSK